MTPYMAPHSPPPPPPHPLASVAAAVLAGSPHTIPSAVDARSLDMAVRAALVATPRAQLADLLPPVVAYGLPASTQWILDATTLATATATTPHPIVGAENLVSLVALALVVRRHTTPTSPTSPTTARWSLRVAPAALMHPELRVQVALDLVAQCSGDMAIGLATDLVHLGVSRPGYARFVAGVLDTVAADAAVSKQTSPQALLALLASRSLVRAVQTADADTVHAILVRIPGPTVNPTLQRQALVAAIISDHRPGALVAALVSDPRIDPTADAWDAAYFAVHHDAADAVAVLLADPRAVNDPDAAVHVADLASAASAVGAHAALAAVYRAAYRHAIAMDPDLMWYTAMVGESQAPTPRRLLYEAGRIAFAQRAALFVESLLPLPSAPVPPRLLMPSSIPAETKTTLLDLPRDVLLIMSEFLDPRSASRLERAARSLKTAAPLLATHPRARLAWLLLYSPMSAPLPPEAHALLYRLPPRHGIAGLGYFAVVAAAARLDAVAVRTVVPHMPTSRRHMLGWAVSAALATAEAAVDASDDDSPEAVARVAALAAPILGPLSLAWPRMMAGFSGRPAFVASILQAASQHVAAVTPPPRPIAQMVLQVFADAPPAALAATIDSMDAADAATDAFHLGCWTAARLGHARALAALRAHPRVVAAASSAGHTIVARDTAVLARHAVVSGDPATLAALFPPRSPTLGPTSNEEGTISIGEAVATLLEHAPGLWSAEWPREAAEMAVVAARAGSVALAAALVRAVWDKAVTDLPPQPQSVAAVPAGATSSAEDRAEIAHAARVVNRAAVAAVARCNGTRSRGEKSRAEAMAADTARVLEPVLRGVDRSPLV
ncbi:hypothetical protein BC828DRAFT_387828 [Blastocladiella britannica]|nr:hypothetical protein BC828DRAFT_387828 [Blastocladiella britannica]